ncbi:ABC transporter ATP-binding protein [Natronosalvus rutilus]|uniref:Probable branched-chain amino acid transport ATP-binding protein LivG n=1 Tax=Natronosalvus rutilus TaxID=2953753 RepID=A0A9E7SVI4_9EURY|nr:ABC transporter ATP-binding protein [Natronosalvus rutilus]UTF54012.1 ABC transporter ATP-binding protein [Natronosalvus rutilus]
MTLLSVEDLRRSFGNLVAVDGVTFEVEAGEIVGMIGPNGAGKTTTFNCLSSVIESDAGTVTFDGEDVTTLPPHALARRGLVRTFQRTRELETLTVEENVLLPAPDHPGERAWHAVGRTGASERREAEARQRALELLEVFDLETMVHEYAGNLSGGQRKLLELARSLMLDPKMLLLDEPFAGVNPSLTNEIVAHIEALNEDGLTLLIIEHELETLTELVDRLVVLADGRVLATGTPAEIMEHEEVIEAYLGG